MLIAHLKPTSLQCLQCIITGVFQKHIVVVLVMSSMTKEELKNALISHGAPVPPASAKKDEFIQVIGAAYELKIELCV